MITEAEPQGFSRDEYEFLKGLVGGMRCGVLTVNRFGCLMLINDPAVQILEIPEPSRCPACRTGLRSICSSTMIAERPSA
jgi:signal transduction histidine kinase